VALLDRTVAEEADPQADHLEAGLVRIESPGRLGEALRHPVHATRPVWNGLVEALACGIVSHHVMGARVHDPGHPRHTGSLEDVIRPQNIGRQQLVPEGRHVRDSGHVHDDIGAARRRFDRRRIRGVPTDQGLIRREIVYDRSIEQDHAVIVPKREPEAPPDAPARAGQQDGLHLTCTSTDGTGMPA